MPEKKEKKTNDQSSFEKKFWEAKDSLKETAWKVWEKGKEVAEEIGISQAQVSRLEKNAINHIRRLFK